ncbi:MAG TPA: YegS/Rv2252/BmrU family lipid kinase [Chloroflexota bacterium]|nr:YegS/Rv2252/BmrU family lipid kinase [Chloroflexota bacterium]
MPLPSEVVLVLSPRAGRAQKAVDRIQAALEREGLTVKAVLDVRDSPGLDRWIPLPEDERPLIVAAGGDGTVGTVANQVAGTGALMGILPLGTSNDVARSLAIPMRLPRAAALLRTGTAATIEAGRVEFGDGTARYFLHAAAAGLNVTFARMATRASLRKRLGRLSYLVSAVAALRERRSFTCTLALPGRERSFQLLHLSVVNAPVFGGFLNLRLEGSDLQDRRLDVLAIEQGDSLRLFLAGAALLLGRTPRIGGIHLYHVPCFSVRVDEPLMLTLDGELASRLPAVFTLAPDAIRVVAPRLQPCLKA